MAVSNKKIGKAYQRLFRLWIMCQSKKSDNLTSNVLFFLGSKWDRVGDITPNDKT